MKNGPYVTNTAKIQKTDATNVALWLELQFDFHIFMSKAIELIKCLEAEERLII